MQKEKDEFNKAFMDEEAAADAPMMDAEAMGDDLADPVNPDADAGLEGEQNVPTDAAAEGAPDPAGGDVTAITLAEGADEGASTEDAKPAADFEQKYKTLQGKYNAEVQRLKDRIAALEGGAGDAPVLQAKDGARVEDDDATEDLFAGPVADAADDALPAEPEMAEGGEVEAPAAAGDDLMAQLEEDYGPDFVKAMDAMIERRARQILEEEGGKFAGDIEQKIEQIVELSAQGLGRLHRSVLLTMRKDAEEVANSPEFGEWVAGLPDEERAQAEAAIDDGDLPELLALFERYDGREGGEESPEDVWAEGAAAGVKGSAPVRLPSRAPASEDDEYKRAWGAF